MPRVLVIGATGIIGREVVSQLISRAVSVRALARNPDTAALPPQVEVVRGDLTLPDTLHPSLHGIDSVFLVWTAPAAAAAPAVQRIARHAPRIVFLSAPLKTPHPFYQQPNPSATLAARIERLIEDSGLPWTFLRPAIFAANSIRWWAPRIRAGETVRWPYLHVPTAPIDERDIAAAAVRALCDPGHSGADYVLTGPQSITQFEQISTIGRVIGRALDIQEISPDHARQELLAIFPPPVIDMLLNAWSAAAGQPAYVNSTVAELTGSPARTFREWATAHAAAFRPSAH